MDRATENARIETWTILKILKWTTDFFKAKGVDTPRLDAEVLLADSLSVDRVRLYLNYDRPLSSDELATFRSRVKRRASREPAAYIIGHREFYGIDLSVTPDVLIPRPETELLVDHALSLSKERWQEEETIYVADIGTGSGAVAVAVAANLSRSDIVAVDVSPAALTVAENNIRGAGLERRVRTIQGNLLEPLAASPPFHVITANLPYIPCHAFIDIMPEVRDYEPRLALDGGDDGLDLIRRVIADAPGSLRDDGILLLEIWPTHGPEIIRLGQAAGFSRVVVQKDLAGRDRVAILDRRSQEKTASGKTEPWTK